MEATVQDRLKMAWHVLRGKPLAYGVEIHGELHAISDSDTWVYHCTFIGDAEIPKPTFWQRIAAWWRRLWRRNG